LDSDFLERIEGNGVHLSAPKLAVFDLQELINDGADSIPSVTSG